MKFIVLDLSDFDKYKSGGTLSFDKNLTIIYTPDEMCIVGISPDDLPTGKWYKRNLNGKEFNYFGICTITELETTLLPKRLFSLLRLRKFIKEIRSCNITNIFSQSPHFVFTLKKYEWSNFCFYFAGLGNSVSLSRYRFLRPLGAIYENILFNNLKLSATCILAAADEASILEKSQKYNLPKNSIIKFPTRFDDNVFFPIDKAKARKLLKIDQDVVLLIATGRLSYIKGWQLLIDAFILFKEFKPHSFLYFVGEGEDRDMIQNYIETLKLQQSVKLIGIVEQKLLSLYLNASDLFLMGSFVEGWPTGMVEALACGKPIVTTHVSGTSEMVENGKNGYILANRDPKKYAIRCTEALMLIEASKISIEKSHQYSLARLKEDLSKVCNYEIERNTEKIILFK